MAAALGATGGQRAMYGILLLTSILLYRNYFYRASGANSALGHFTLVIIAAAIGYGGAAVVTPIATRWLSKAALITVLLALGGVVTGVLGPTFAQPAFLAISLILGLVAQGVAICSVTIIQQRMDDDYRGRVFALYDMLFNVPFVLGALVAALIIPDSGKSYLLIAVAAAGYLLAAVAYGVVSRQELLAGPSPAGSFPAAPPPAGPAPSGPSPAGPAPSGPSPAGPSPLPGSSTPAWPGDVVPPPAGNPLGLRPAPQLLSGPLGPQRPPLHAQLQQVPVRLADHRARPHAEDLHDLVAVQVRADLLQLFPLGQERYALLQVVVGAGQPGGLLPVPGRAVGPRERVQPGEQRPGVAHVAPHRRVGPAALVVSVEPQMEADQGGHVVHHALGKRSWLSRARAIEAPTTS